MHDDERRWDARYAEAASDLPRAPEAILDHPAVLEAVPTSGRALDLACGSGRQAVWAAERGLEVTAVDISGRALGLLGELARSRNVEGSIEVLQRDLDEVATVAAELTQRAPGGYDLVLCQRYRDPRWYVALLDLVAPEGMLILTVLSEVGWVDDGGSGPGRSHRAPAGELATLGRPGWERILDVERDGIASIVAIAPLRGLPA